MLTKFNDKKLFYNISNCQTNKIETCERWEEGKKVKKKLPISVMNYMRHMRGIDISNKFISEYEMDSKTVKWWKRIFLHL